MNKIPNELMQKIHHQAYETLKAELPVQDLFLDGYPFWIVELNDGKKREFWATPHLHPAHDKNYKADGFDLLTLDIRVLYRVDPKSKTLETFKLFS